MKIWEVVQKLLRFYTEYDEFELLEAEKGTPPTAFHRPASSRRGPTAPGEETISFQSHVGAKQKLSASLEKNISIM